jgi:tRNA 2-thiouridine synthesizing protein A
MIWSFSWISVAFITTQRILFINSNMAHGVNDNMSDELDITETLDVKGASCPMPVVKTKSAIDDLEAGAVLEVLATDPGSMSDIDGWATGTQGVELLEQREGNDLYRHYVRKTD